MPRKVDFWRELDESKNSIVFSGGMGKWLYLVKRYGYDKGVIIM